MLKKIDYFFKKRRYEINHAVFILFILCLFGLVTRDLVIYFTSYKTFNAIILLFIILSLFGRYMKIHESYVFLKNKIKLYINIIIVLYTIVILLNITKIDSTILFNHTLFQILVFLLITFSYYSFFSKKEERVLIVNIYKIYFPTIILIIIAMYSIVNDVVVLDNDFHKIQISVEKNKNKKLEYINSYKDFIDDKKSILESEPIAKKTKDTSNESNKKKKQEEKLNILVNLLASITLVLTNFCWIAFLKDSNILENKKTKFIRYKKKRNFE